MRLKQVCQDQVRPNQFPPLTNNDNEDLFNIMISHTQFMTKQEEESINGKNNANIGWLIGAKDNRVMQVTVTFVWFLRQEVR